MKRILFSGVFLLLISFSFAQDLDSIWFVNHYQKVEQYIPARDGVKLFTSVYIPKDTTTKHPILLSRTPYSCAPYGEDYRPLWKDRYSYKLARLGYIFVFQDVRGRYMSEGKFVDVRPFNKNKKGRETDEASDAYDAIDWLVKNIEGNNGKVAVSGISYPGFYSTEAALSGHPALVVVSPQAPVTDWFMGDDFHHKGAFFVMDAFSFYPFFGTPHPKPSTRYTQGFSFESSDNYAAYLNTGSLKNFAKLMGDSISFWQDLYQHPNYDDWWKERNARVGLYNVKPAMLWVGGLFDAEDCFGAWNSYKATETQSPETNNRIVMGPWFHGQWVRGDGSYLGNVAFGKQTSFFFQDSIMIPYLNHYLLGEEDPQLSKATIFFSGENNWKRFDQWPPKNTQEKNLYLTENFGLALDKIPASSNTYDQYISDPAHPVPYTQDIHFKRTREYMTDDQRFASRRPDVLTYQTPVLTEDITLAGPVIADLMVSLSTSDADFLVKVIDVFPDQFAYPADWTTNGLNYPMGGYQMLVRGEIMRGKFRNSFEHPEAFIPGEIAEVKWELPDVAHTFRKGHRLMIQIQSSWFPLVDRNPQKFTDIYQADDSDFQKSTIRVYHDAGHASKIILPVMR